MRSGQPALAHKADLEGYPHARRLAAVGTGLPLTTFPATCPWAGEQVLDEDFWPGVASDGV